MRCASYVKYASCIPEKEIPSDIIRQQNDRIRKYIKSKGWELTEKYTERKKDTEAEEVFQTLREDGINRKFDMVVVDSIFRCGRNVSFAEDVLLKTFYPAGIHFAVVEDDFCSMYLSAGDVAAYVKKKRDQYIGGMMTYRSRIAQAEGYLTVHDEKYGYFLNEERKGFVIDEEVAPIIREIFYLLSEKEMKYSEVAALMNERGYESPMKHLARVGQKNIPDCRSHWGLYSVQRIAQNTAYIGYWYKMVDGERKKLEIPPIVPKEQFDRIAQRYELSPNKHHGEERSKNAFVKQIFDKGTGTPLVCRLHRAEKPYQTFSLEFWDQDRIEYDYVMEEAVAALFAEQELAQIAGKLVDTKMCADELNRRKEVLGEKARLLFAKMVEVEQEHIPLYCQKENGEISETEYIRQRTEIFEVLAEQEKEFAKLMEQVQMLETAYSRGNPWIQFYSRIEIPDVLEKAQVRKWIDRLLIKDLETVEVIFPEKYTKWKDILPPQWFMEGA